MPEESLRRGSLWMISGQAVAMAAQAVYFVLIGRALGSREYGAFVGVAALVAALSMFSTLGMEMILVRNISRDRASFARTWGHALVITSIGFLLLLAAAMLYAHFALRPELRPLVPWIALADGFARQARPARRPRFPGRRPPCLDRSPHRSHLRRTRRHRRSPLGLGPRPLHPCHRAALGEGLLASTLVVAVFALALATLRLGAPALRAYPSRRSHRRPQLFVLSSSSISVYNDIDKTFLVTPRPDLGRRHLLRRLSRRRCRQRAHLWRLRRRRSALLSRRRHRSPPRPRLRSHHAQPHPALFHRALLRSVSWRAVAACCSLVHRFADRSTLSAGSACCPSCALSTTRGAPPSPPPLRSGTAPRRSSAQPPSTCASIFF